jgi:hypothetical protein
MVAGQYLSGLSRLRLHMRTLSDVLRYDRAEGLFAGGGAVLRPTAGLTLRGQLGYGFSSGHFSGAVRLGRAEPEHGASLDVHVNELRDLGPVPASEGVLNTLSVLVAGEDYLDPFFATGARLTLPRWDGPVDLTAAVAIERHRSATLTVANDDGSLRPVRPIDEGDLLAADISLETSLGAEWTAAGHARYGALEGEQFATLRVDGGWAREAAWRELNVSATAQGGIVTARSPAQELFLLGGRGTLLGHPYRELVGDRFWLVDLRASRSLFSPWLTGRAFAATGWTQLRQHALPVGWTGDGDAGVKSSIGLGLGLAWDILQIDLGRGLGGGGGWGLALSASRRFRGWL